MKQKHETVWRLNQVGRRQAPRWLGAAGARASAAGVATGSGPCAALWSWAGQAHATSSAAGRNTAAAQAAAAVMEQLPHLRFGGSAAAPPPGKPGLCWRGWAGGQAGARRQDACSPRGWCAGVALLAATLQANPMFRLLSSACWTRSQLQMASSLTLAWRPLALCLLPRCQQTTWRLCSRSSSRSLLQSRMRRSSFRQTSCRRLVGRTGQAGGRRLWGNGGGAHALVFGRVKWLELVFVDACCCGMLRPMPPGALAASNRILSLPSWRAADRSAAGSSGRCTRHGIHAAHGSTAAAWAAA